MGVSKNNGTSKSSILNGVFHYKPSILGYPYFWKHPNGFIFREFQNGVPKRGVGHFFHLESAAVEISGSGPGR